MTPSVPHVPMICFRSAERITRPIGMNVNLKKRKYEKKKIEKCKQCDYLGFSKETLSND